MLFLFNRKPGRLALALVAACTAFLLGVLPLLTADASAAQSKQTAFFSPTDPAIYYLGRVKREQSTLLTWPGSGFRVVYNNSTTVIVKLYANDFWEESTHNTAKMV